MDNKGNTVDNPTRKVDTQVHSADMPAPETNEVLS
jgi:hypothetical protein